MPSSNINPRKRDRPTPCNLLEGRFRREVRPIHDHVVDGYEICGISGGVLIDDGRGVTPMGADLKLKERDGISTVWATRTCEEGHVGPIDMIDHRGYIIV